MVGAPYRWGGSSPQGFDCSGLVYYSYQDAGISVPRTVTEQRKASAPIRLNDARPGDLLFFRIRWKVSHVGIYTGDGQFVHAPSTGKRVVVASLNNEYYRKHLVSVGRLYDMQ